MTPTPETDQAQAPWLPWPGVHANFARKLERERDEARDRAESKHGLWMAELSRVTELEKQLEAMREAIKEVYEALTGCVDDSGELLAERGWWRDEPRCGYQARYEETKQRIEDAKAALAKLQPFLKP